MLKTARARLRPFYRPLRPIYSPLIRLHGATINAYYQRRRWRSQVKSLRQNGSSIRVVIGAGGDTYDHWINTEYPGFDITRQQHWAEIFDPISIDRLLAEHVMEHLTVEQFRRFLGFAKPYVTPNGFIRVAVPDGYHPDPAYISYVMPGGTGLAADDHKVLYNHDLLVSVLQSEGYDCRLLEYYDRAGTLHAAEWNAADGTIKRSARSDWPRQALSVPFAYSSLIVDCWLSRGG